MVGWNKIIHDYTGFYDFNGKPFQTRMWFPSVGTVLFIMFDATPANVGENDILNDIRERYEAQCNLPELLWTFEEHDEPKPN